MSRMRRPSKLAIWRGVSGIFGWKRPPNGEFWFRMDAKWALSSLAGLLSISIVATAQTNPAATLPPQQFADLGECVLESGAVIADC